MSSTSHRPQDHKIYRYIYIIKKTPKWGRGIRQPGPSQPAQTGRGLKSQSPALSLEELPPHSAECSFRAPAFCCSGICCRGWAPFQRGPKASGLWKNGVLQSSFLSLQAHKLRVSRLGLGGAVHLEHLEGLPYCPPPPAREPHAAVRMWDVGCSFLMCPLLAHARHAGHEGV